MMEELYTYGGGLSVGGSLGRICRDPNIGGQYLVIP